MDRDTTGWDYRSLGRPGDNFLLHNYGKLVLVGDWASTQAIDTSIDNQYTIGMR
jgi:hypothetical protein